MCWWSGDISGLPCRVSKTRSELSSNYYNCNLRLGQSQVLRFVRKSGLLYVYHTSNPVKEDSFRRERERDQRDLRSIALCSENTYKLNLLLTNLEDSHSTQSRKSIQNPARRTIPVLRNFCEDLFTGRIFKLISSWNPWRNMVLIIPRRSEKL